MGWNQAELDRQARVKAESRAAEAAARKAKPGRTPDRDKTRNTAVPGKQPDRSKGINVHNVAVPGKQPDRNKACERRKYVVMSKKCGHGPKDAVVELEATGAVLALVAAGVLRLYVKAAIKAEDKEASDG